MGYLSEKKILSLFEDGTLHGRTFSSLCKFFSREGIGSRMLGDAIDRLVDCGKLVKQDGRFFLPDDGARKGCFRDEPLLSGVFRCKKQGFGFVTVEGDKDYFIKSDRMGQALNGDTVSIRKLGGVFGDLAEIVKVEKRGQKRLVGTVFTEGGLTYVRPDDEGYFADIFVGGELKNELGDKVVVEMTKYPRNRCPEGEIILTLGRQFDLKTEEAALILTRGVEEPFAESVLEEVKSVPLAVGKKDIMGRRDLRDKPIFTIDGESAKDFDDAVSLERDEEGNYLLGVHIADVSHYVGRGSEIDRSALSRGTSVYLPDRVIPMLPFELSNGICSLNQGVDRLPVSVVMKISDDGETLDVDIFKSVIKSTYRLTYTFVQSILEGDEEACGRHAELTSVIREMHELKRKLENRRRAAGFIDLEVKESEVAVNGDEISVGAHVKNDATELIEHFMIAANEAVAGYLFYQSLPCVYRVHEKPTAEKLEQLKAFLKALGINVNWRKDECFPSDLQRLLRDASKTRFFSVVNRMVLRSMQKACYNAANLGHFGLASKCYCHFTSPIRRYPDLVVHRILKSALDGEILPLIEEYEALTFSASDACSKKERAADELERDVDALYKTQYMSGKIGERFVGIISSVLSVGFFVELENTCEGFVPIELLPAGTYTFDKEKMTLSTYRRTFKLGDRVKICVVSADIASRKVDFCLAK